MFVWGFFFKDFIYLFLERREGKEKERERNINVWLLLMCPLLGTWPATQACALDWELNQRPFSSQACTQSTELHHPGLFEMFYHFSSYIYISDPFWVNYRMWNVVEPRWSFKNKNQILWLSLLKIHCWLSTAIRNNPSSQHKVFILIAFPCPQPCTLGCCSPSRLLTALNSCKLLPVSMFLHCCSLQLKHRICGGYFHSLSLSFKCLLQ